VTYDFYACGCLCNLWCRVYFVNCVTQSFAQSSMVMHVFLKVLCHWLEHLCPALRLLFFFTYWNFHILHHLGEYLMNREPSIATPRSLAPCPERLPSCIGLSDGRHEFPGRRWWSAYIVCYHNRTVELSRCAQGYFDPYRRVCVQWIPMSECHHLYRALLFIILSFCILLTEIVVITRGTHHYM
jgi:hypothetical protein